MNNVEELFREEDMKELKEIIYDFLKNINSDIKIEFETQFVSSMSEKKVYIGLLPLIQGFKSNEELQELYKEKGFEYHDFYIFALLHEIGHIETTKHLTERELNLSLTAYQFYCTELEKKYKKDKEFLEHYLELTLEKLANNWALDYIEDNYFEVIAFTEKFYKQFDKMLENIVED